jgi:hypothetical protein
VSARSSTISPASAAESAEDRVAIYNWQALAGELSNYGCTVLLNLLSADECRAIANLCSLNTSVSSESAAVPEYQPRTDALLPIRSKVSTVTGPTAPIIIIVPLGPRPPAMACMACALVTVARIALAPPIACIGSLRSQLHLRKSHLGPRSI